MTTVLLLALAALLCSVHTCRVEQSAFLARRRAERERYDALAREMGGPISPTW